MMASLRPSIGITNSRLSELWNLTGSELALGEQREPEPRLRAELADGLRRGAALLTPYTNLSIILMVDFTTQFRASWLHLPSEPMPGTTERPWRSVVINDCGEPLAPLPEGLPRVMPHSYASLGAPYPAGRDPWRLRLAVVVRLLRARSILQATRPGWDLQIFDAWRPIAVQVFMIDHSLRTELASGSPSQQADPAWRRQVEQQVRHLWAIPSRDPRTPPPHSTGAAVDLTLVDHDGEPVPMGSPIDALGPESHPDHFARDPHGTTAHRNRLGLRQAMVAAGFVMHPWEWWHFSFGDQLWAWQTGQVAARYGAVTGCQPIANQ